MSSSGTLVRDALAPVAGRVLQICHGYSGPFGDVARQYVDALGRLGYEVDTVYLTGAPSEEVVRLTGGATVSFLGQQSDDIGGLKSGAIRAVARLCARADYAFCVTHRFKPAFVACLATSLPVLAVFHAYGTFARRTLLDGARSTAGAGDSRRSIHRRSRFCRDPDRSRRDARPGRPHDPPLGRGAARSVCRRGLHRRDRAGRGRSTEALR